MLINEWKFVVVVVVVVVVELMLYGASLTDWMILLLHDLYYFSGHEPE